MLLLSFESILIQAIVFYSYLIYYILEKSVNRGKFKMESLNLRKIEAGVIITLFILG